MCIRDFVSFYNGELPNLIQKGIKTIHMDHTINFIFKKFNDLMLENFDNSSSNFKK